MTTQISSDNIQAATLAELSPVTITSITVTNSSWTPLDDSAVSTSGGYIVITGTNFASGCNVIISSTNATSVTFVNSTTLRVQVPAMSAGTYVVYVVNTNGSTAIIVNGLTYSGTPTWVTASPLPQGTSGVAISIQLSATGDAPLTYVLQAGSSLPAGLTLTSGGLLSGTVSGLTSETTYNFTIEAIDAQSQESPKAFAITIIAGDQYWDYVSLLLPGTTNTSIFNDDASTNNFNITITGDTRPSNLSPYTPGYYSNFFDGTGDYFTLPSATSALYLSGAFTFETWIYPTSSSGLIYGNWNNQTGDAWQFGYNTAGSFSTGFKIFWYRGNYGTNEAALGTTTGLNLNTWNHFAVTRDASNNIYFFLNGVSLSLSTYGANGLTWSNSFNFTNTSAIGIGGTSNYSSFNGYISNLRFISGSALYTANFTPSTIPLTAISNTQLLTCQSNRFIDNSTNNLTLTRNGDVTVNSFDPFVPSSSYASIGSTYFDGSGDYLSTVGTPINFGTGNFTIEWWVYRITSQGGDRDELPMGGVGGTSFMLGMQAGTLQFGISGTSWNITSSITVPLSVWAHCAIARVGSTVTMYINGVSAGTATMSTNFTGATAFDIGRRQGASVNNIQVYCSNLRIVNGTAVYTGAFTPPTSPLTAVAGTSLLTCQTNQPADNNDFLDSGTNNIVITRNGNTTQGTFSPYAENWSNYFDGTSDSISYTGGSSLNFGTSDFTIETWAFLTNTGTFSAFIRPDDSGAFPEWGYDFSSSQLKFDARNGSIVATSTSMPVNQWVHLAVSRSGTSLRQFVNGTQVGSTTTNSTNFGSTTGVIRIGGSSFSGSHSVNGYLSNFRVVKGTALYTTTFTPSTTPLQPILNTSLLTCRDASIVDDSANRFTLTRNGDVSVQKFGPFAGTTLPTPYYGAYFRPSAVDSLVTPSNAAFGMGTGNWTIEGWYYTGSSSNDFAVAWHIGTINAADGMAGSVASNFVRFRSNGTTDISAAVSITNTWTHVAWVKSSNIVTIYVNGTSVVTGTYTNSIATGVCTVVYNSTSFRFDGYISNFRVVKGQALYTTTFTPSTTPLTTTSQGATASNVSLLTCQSATFIDNSTNNFTITANGNSQPTIYNPFTVSYSTMQSYSPSVFGGSMYFDGNGDFLTYPNSSLFAFGTGSFTIEFWINAPLNNDKFILGGRAAIGTMHITTGGFSSTAGVLRYVGSATIVSSNVITDNTWHHCAIVRNGSTAITLYVDGVAVGTGSDSTNYTTTSGTWNIGKNDSGDTGYLTGYISDLRVIRGQALYTSNFVPSNAPLTAVQNTVLLLNGTAGGIIDVSSNNDFETVGDAKLSVAQSKWSSTSMYFDGTGDYCKSVVPSPNFAFGTGNFTIECWIYRAGNGSNPTVHECVFGTRVGAGGFAANQFQVYTLSSQQLWFQARTNSYDSQFGSSSLSMNNSWNHIAVVRTATNITLYFNGVSVASETINAVTQIGDTTNRFNIGAFGDGSYTFNGYVQDLRVTKGIARYTANFTPPSTPFITY